MFDQIQLNSNLSDTSSCELFDIDETVNWLIADKTRWLNEHELWDYLFSDIFLPNTETTSKNDEKNPHCAYFKEYSTSSQLSQSINERFIPPITDDQENNFFSSNSNSNISNPEPTPQYNILQNSSSLSSINKKINRKRGRPKTNSYQKDKKQKLGRIWEFIRDILLNKKTCPSLIKWDDYKTGTFKFVQSDRIAKIWGNRSDNESMNFEKFSRAMRYHYKNKTLLPVKGKKLVYQFGPRASGWQTSCPILD